MAQTEAPMNLDKPSREADAEIAAAIRYFPKGVGFVWQAGLKPNSPQIGRVECETTLGTGGPHYKAPTYTSNIDAALSLVPEGMEYGIGSKDATNTAWAWIGTAAVCEHMANAPTPALAICRAALKARGIE